MALFVMSDLHLSTQNQSKSMDVFGSRWNHYTEKIENNWRHLITERDTVIIPGDISWGLTADDALPDLIFLDQLPGQKILSKGNHDFWWSTVTKLEKMFAENHLSSLHLLNNNAIKLGNTVIAGSRGWFSDPSLQVATNKPDYQKIMNREAIRLRMSMKEAKRLATEQEDTILAFFHFPPVWNDFCSRETLDILHEFEVTQIYFGHIHGVYNFEGNVTVEGIRMTMVSADYLNFIPLLIS